MAITVKGVEVRTDEVNVETEFRFLTEEGQKRLFLENKEVFLLEALSSNYPAVRSLLWEPEVLQTCSSDLLNEAIGICWMDPKTSDLVTLINAVGSELSEHNIELIIYAPWIDANARTLVAQNEKTSLELLKSMFNLAVLDLIQENETRLFDAIILNPNFEWDKEMKERMEVFSPEGRRMIRKRIIEIVKKYTD